MRWVSFAGKGGDTRAGVVHDGQVYGLPDATSMLAVVQRGPAAMRELGEHTVKTSRLVVPYESIAPRPLLTPPSIRDCAGFLQHRRNCAPASGTVIDERFTRYPAFYFANPAVVAGATDDIAISPRSRQFDFELEVCAIIGKPGSSIPRDQAEAHIAGFAIFCDWSARDLLVGELPLRLGPAKGKDGANTIGPMLVTPDEIESFRGDRGYKLAMSAYVNGVQITHGSWDEIDWGFDDMITYTSRGTRLVAGDVLASGTVPTGCLFEQFAQQPDEFPGWLKAGDEVWMSVEQLGELRHRIVEAEAAPPLSNGY